MQPMATSSAPVLPMAFGPPRAAALLHAACAGPRAPQGRCLTATAGWLERFLLGKSNVDPGVINPYLFI